MAMSMKHTMLRVAAATFGIAMLAFLSGNGLSQDKQEKPKKEAPAVAQVKQDDAAAGELKPKHPSLIRVGYTRPGAPEDRVNKKGKIIPAFLDPERDPKEPVIGGTVYFAVFRIDAAQGEMEKELASLPGAFVKGRNFENGYSPDFDRKAKYLYLYQIVNDRGLDPAPDAIAFAADRDLEVSTVSNFGLRILVDPRYITSWGYFRDRSFSAAVPTRDRKGDIAPAADGENNILPVAFSSVPSILAELPVKKYEDGAPAHDLGKLKRDFGISSSDLNLDRTPAAAQLRKKKETGVALVNWEDNQLQALEGGKAPDYVQIVLDSYREVEEPTLDGRYLGDVVFRADFQTANALQVGQHSVVFGFTTDLPPEDEPIRIEGFMPRADGEPIRPAAFGEGAAGTGTAVATGTAPTPQGGAAAAPFAAGTPALGSLGGGAGVGGLGGGGLGGAGFVPGGGFGAARAPIFGGGGTGGGTGGGEGGGQGIGTGEPVEGEQQQGQNINFNVTQTNTQTQQQSQAQAQAQAQAQVQTQTQVIPAPPALLLGLLGFPAIFWLRRKSPVA